MRDGFERAYLYTGQGRAVDVWFTGGAGILDLLAVFHGDRRHFIIVIIYDNAQYPPWAGFCARVVVAFGAHVSIYCDEIIP